ncbi:MAG: transposase [Candidatus Omnitrophica bacterium]|nr:transposase [Candidatus Omnitrophota bacterium]
MPRRARIVIPNIPHHLTQRGNYGRTIFKTNNEHLTYCDLINKYAQKYGVHIIGYCLMPNHVHFILIPSESTSLARMCNTAHMKYSQYINKKHDQKGHLWQGRFFSCPLNEDHLYRALRYVERNPVRAGLTKEPWDHPWSSAQYHIGRPHSYIDICNEIQLMDHKSWKDFILVADQEMENILRIITRKGHV